MIERIVVMKAVKHGGHPPGETLDLPDAPQTDLRVTLELRRTARLIEMIERSGKYSHIGHGQVQSLRTGWWHDVCRVSGQEQPSILHRFRDEAAHARDAFL